MDAKPSFSWWALLLCAGALIAQDDADSESPTITSLDEIEVTASHSILREEPVSAVALSREQIDNLLHFGDDLYRAISVLPGTSGGDFSSAFNVRGGFNRENPRGSAIGDPHYHPRPDGSVEVLFPVEAWLPILPSFGVSYRF